MTKCVADVDGVVVDVGKAAVSVARAVDRIVPRVLDRAQDDLKDKLAAHVVHSPETGLVSRGFWFTPMKLI